MKGMFIVMKIKKLESCVKRSKKMKMNHIEIYEKLYNEATDYEIKSLIKQFYSMEISKANQAIDLVKVMIDSKTNYYMTND